MASHIGRSPFSHQLLAIQKWKKQAVSGYMTRLGKLVARVTTELEELMSDDAIDDVSVWKRVIAVATREDTGIVADLDGCWTRREVIDLIFKVTMTILRCFVCAVCYLLSWCGLSVWLVCVVHVMWLLTYGTSSCTTEAHHTLNPQHHNQHHRLNNTSCN